MNAQIFGLRVAGTVFGIVCIAQLVRLLFFSGVRVTVGGFEMPLWPNAVAFVILGGLCIWMWTLSYGSRKQ